MAPERFNVLNALRFLIKRFNECVTFVIKSALRRFKCLGSLNSAENVGKRVGTFGKFTRELSSCLLVLQGYVQVTGEYFCLKETTHTYTQFFYHLQSAIRGAQTRRWTVFGVSCWLT